ncbi:hypothetical protein Emed_004550 [Eimeria media]
MMKVVWLPEADGLMGAPQLGPPSGGPLLNQLQSAAHKGSNDGCSLCTICISSAAATPRAAATIALAAATAGVTAAAAAIPAAARVSLCFVRHPKVSPL